MSRRGFPVLMRERHVRLPESAATGMSFPLQKGRPRQRGASPEATARTPCLGHSLPFAVPPSTAHPGFRHAFRGKKKAHTSCIFKLLWAIVETCGFSSGGGEGVKLFCISLFLYIFKKSKKIMHPTMYPQKNFLLF